MYWTELISPFAYFSAARFKALAIATPQTKKRGSLSLGKSTNWHVESSHMVSQNIHL